MIRVSIILLGWTISMTALAQHPVSLDTIVKVIRERHPAIKNYASRADAMQAYASGSGSWVAPEVGGGLWMVPYKRVTDQRDKGQIMISVQQKFTNPAKLRASRGYQESRAAIENASGGVVLNQLRTAAKLAYLQWIIYEKRRSVLHQGEAIVEQMLRIAQARYAYNQSNLSSIYKSEARLQEIRDMIQMNDSQITQKNIELDQLMNIPLTSRFAIDTTYSPDLQVPDEDDSTLIAGRRSDIRKIDKTMLSVRLNRTLEEAQARPDFNLSFNHMIARGSGMPNQFMLLGMISVPIAPWSSGGYKANVRGMTKEIESMKNERAAILSETLGAVAGMREDLSALRKQVENYQTRIIPSLRKSYSSLMVAYEQNKEELPVVIDAWETLNMTQLQYLTSLQKLWETKTEYDREIEN